MGEDKGEDSQARVSQAKECRVLGLLVESLVFRRLLLRCNVLSRVSRHRFQRCGQPVNRVLLTKSRTKDPSSGSCLSPWSLLALLSTHVDMVKLWQSRLYHVSQNWPRRLRSNRSSPLPPRNCSAGSIPGQSLVGTRRVYLSYMKTTEIDPLLVNVGCAGPISHLRPVPAKPGSVQRPNQRVPGPNPGASRSPSL